MTLNTCPIQIRRATIHTGIHPSNYPLVVSRIYSPVPQRFHPRFSSCQVLCQVSRAGTIPTRNNTTQLSESFHSCNRVQHDTHSSNHVLTSSTEQAQSTTAPSSSSSRLIHVLTPSLILRTPYDRVFVTRPSPSVTPPRTVPFYNPFPIILTFHSSTYPRHRTVSAVLPIPSPQTGRGAGRRPVRPRARPRQRRVVSPVASEGGTGHCSPGRPSEGGGLLLLLYSTPRT